MSCIGPLLCAALLLPVALSGCAGEDGEDAPPMVPPATPPSPPPARFGHEHSVFRLFVAGEEIAFGEPVFDYSSTRHARAHLHLGGPESTSAQYVIHKEGELGADLVEFFGTLGVLLHENEVHLDSMVHEGRTVTNNLTHSWQLWVDACGDGPDDWLLAPSFYQYVPQQHDRLLLTFARNRITPAVPAADVGAVPTHATLDEQLHDACAT